MARTFFFALMTCTHCETNAPFDTSGVAKSTKKDVGGCDTLTSLVLAWTMQSSQIHNDINLWDETPPLTNV